jgi:hypothetical protein
MIYYKLPIEKMNIYFKEHSFNVVNRIGPPGSTTSNSVERTIIIS